MLLQLHDLVQSSQNHVSFPIQPSEGLPLLLVILGVRWDVHAEGSHHPTRVAAAMRSR